MAFVDKTDVIGAVSTNPLTLNVPAHSDGDLLVTFAGGWFNGLSSDVTPPGGWTFLTGSTASATIGGGIHAYYRIASSEPGSYNWTFAGNVRCFASCVSYSGDASGTIHGDFDWQANGTTSPRTLTLGSHAVAFSTGTIVYGFFSQSSGGNFAGATHTPDAACTARGSTIFEQANCGILSVADEDLTGTTPEPARTFTTTWTEIGGGHRGVLIRVVGLLPAAAAGTDAWGFTT
jgi:hypothetical protein